MKLRVLYEYWDVPGGFPYDLTKTKKKKRDMSKLKYPEDRERFLKNMKMGQK